MVFDEINGIYYCEECGAEMISCEEYDTYYCSSCDTWGEEKCEDEYCPFCPTRPDKPSQLDDSEK